MSFSQLTRFLLVLAALFGACDPQISDPYVEGDSGTDADSDSDADAGPDWTCPDPPTAICAESHAYDLLGQAADFDEGLAFADVEGEGVFLAERPDGSGGTEPVLVARAWETSFEDVPGEYAVVALNEAPSEPLRAVAIVSPRSIYSSDYGFSSEGSIIGYPAVILLCGESGCALYGVFVDSIDAAHLAWIPNGEVPIDDARGLVFREPADYDTFENTICAFGDGIACFDGSTWTTMLSPGGPLLLSATTYWESWHTYLLASGAACRLVRQSADGFEEIPLSCDVDLKTVSSGHEFFAAGGDGILVLGFPEETLECPLAGVDIVQLRGQSYNYEEEMHRWVTAFAQDGSVVEVRYSDTDSTSCTSLDPLDGPARAWSFIAPYTDAWGSTVVTESSVYWRIEGGGPGE
ncbi:MAG: hypothetical protein M0R80_16430 [Proteobacteria bacterium]|jgi:hypothetical protein|nr:hypothetical protein [Pseudomonadota bacterium]